MSDDRSSIVLSEEFNHIAVSALRVVYGVFSFEV